MSLLQGARKYLLRPRNGPVPRCLSATCARRQLHYSGALQKQRASSPSADPATTAQPTVIFSGIQPTGVPHLGNYLGALRQWVSLQNEAAPSTTLYYSIVDLHSLTSRSQSPAERKLAKRQALASLLACGLDPTRSVLYHQSSVPQHAELHWILSCDASMGLLSRMTQWKSKLADDGVIIEDPLDKQSPNPRSAERLKLGLFSYPVLQAADILLYAATHVPVGEDQVQHIEFARNTANVFNSTYGRSSEKAKARQILTPPDCIVSPAKRVMSLAEPEKKMSKSHALLRSRILITDSAEEIGKKIRAAVTDSEDTVTYNPAQRPGVSNLLDIISYMENGGHGPQDVASDFQNMQVTGSRLRVLKELAATVVTQHLHPIRQNYERLLGERNGKDVDDIAHQGQEKASKKAEKTMREVREAIGIS
ncbi:hypothetical protein FH972_023565 [Carpinus fangiana]|uniref:tryptophan--tRNA ligase n=1 Tax=Carpinus fangiana TaxID=176857 RepID=A0A5N6KW20_9ROSI|nr:hypothetical protein FH972_023565 [Carpinus fangiana]